MYVHLEFNILNKSDYDRNNQVLYKEIIHISQINSAA